MSKQRLDEWQKLNADDLAYHLRQWSRANRSTVAFADFIEPVARQSRVIVDVCCGAGGATSCVAERFPAASFVGIDISAQLIALANEKASGHPTLKFEIGDCYDLARRSDVTGVISLQSLSWLPDWQRPLEQMIEKLRPEWIALSSLFWPGDISCQIKVEEHARSRETFYNVYALPRVSAFANALGMRVSKYEPFEIDIDLPSPDRMDVMATRTVMTADSHRLQISGPVLMNWGFVLLERA
jgi:SAM-dependent methyltransferase